MKDLIRISSFENDEGWSGFWKFGMELGSKNCENRMKRFT